jgi:phage tail tape-measure protein
MDVVAQTALQGAGKGAMMGASIGSIIPGLGTAVGGVVGGLVGGAAGFFKGKKDKGVNAGIAAEEAQLEQQNNEARNLLAKNENKRKQLEQWNAADAQDKSYNNDAYSEMAGTSTLPMAGAENLPVTAPAGTQTQTSSEAQLQALGVIS